jgi:hypothetical protein
VPAPAFTLTRPPRTRICFVASGTRLPLSTGFTVTVVGLVADGVIALDAARLKSSARFATVPSVITSG